MGTVVSKPKKDKRTSIPEKFPKPPVASTSDTEEVEGKRPLVASTSDTEQVEGKRPLVASTSDTDQVEGKKPLVASTSETDQVEGKKPLVASTSDTDQVEGKKPLVASTSDTDQVEGKKPLVASTSDTDQVDGKKPLVVIAIDFGTVHSGFAYSFKGNEEQIHTAERSKVLEQDRVPTALLLNPDGTFNSFGSKAQFNYDELSENDRRQFFYVENFKMQIYLKDKISRDMKIPDISGKKVKAMKVFSMAIKHLKSLAEKIVFLTKLELNESVIQWMITIPTVSSDSSRQFMREAAINAGIPDTQIRLVLEPEAAALYSRPRVFMQGEVPVGFKYILADLGGGTSDICVHETLSDGKLREIYRTSGKKSGGSDVDKKFIDFMKNLVGNKVWQEFSSNHSFAYKSLINDFQTKKKDFKPETKTITLRMENALVHVLRETRKTTLENIIKNSHFDKLDFQPIEFRLSIQAEIIEEFFKPSVDKIIYILKDILKACQDNEIRTLLLVGGYSESPYVRERIQAAFSDLRVVLVDDARLTVLKGAVMMGWKPKNIIQRRSRFTYGFRVRKPFEEGNHPESLKLIVDGKVWCKRVFEKMIKKGEIVEYGETFIFKGYDTFKDQKEKHEDKYTSLYRSTREDPLYCTKEEECTEVGQIVCKPPPEGWPDYLDNEKHLIVGETELTVKNFNLTTGEEYEAQMDFL